MRTASIVRYVLIGLGAALGVALLVRGNLLIGGLILSMAVLRLLMVLDFHRRRRQFVAHREQVREEMRRRWQAHTGQSWPGQWPAPGAGPGQGPAA
jgi:hypothetical protein